jgi:hypothetical protein
MRKYKRLQRKRRYCKHIGSMTPIYARKVIDTTNKDFRSNIEMYWVCNSCKHGKWW